MFWKKKTRKISVEDSRARFARDLRAKIENNLVKPSGTSGIHVFEHDNEDALDEKEKEILKHFRKAHEEWTAENPKISHDSNVSNVFDTVRMRSLPSG